jgi:hypothetical protein
MDWIASTIGDDLFHRLATELPGTELQSLLLEIFRRRARARTPGEVLAQYKRDRFVMPAAVDLREALAIDLELLAAAADFEAIELSPITPLATSSSVAVSDQHRVVSALRGTEVVSDPTNVLALICAARGPARPHHLVTSMRVVRAQPTPKEPGFTQHFRLFALASGGVETADHAFTVDTVVRHIEVLQAGLDRLEARGYAFGARRVDVLATPQRAELGDRIAARVGGARKLLEHPYYSGGLRFMLWVTAPDGREIPLGDGGTFDWLAKLAANRRAVFVGSGLGAQLVAMVCRAAISPDSTARIDSCSHI